MRSKADVVAKINEMEAQMRSKNSYINNFRRDDIVAAATVKEEADELNARGYDNINEMEDETADRS